MTVRLTTVMQFAEGLSDRQVADPVRSRIDWEYALSLELSGPGFDYTVLSEFRTRLTAGQAEFLLLDTFLARVRERGLLKVRGRQRTDSTHALVAIRALNRLELVGETLRHALNSPAVVAPAWLQAHHEAIQAARQRQETAAFTAYYARRAGIEGTHTQAIRRCGLRQCRYIGQAKTHLQHVHTTTALNLVRVAAWLEDIPEATTRRSAFATLAA